MRLKAKISNYRNYKSFIQSTFWKEIESRDFSPDSDDPNKRYSYLNDTLLRAVNKYLP